MFFIPEYIQTLKPYKAGNQVKKSDFSSPFSYLINLASNENPFGGSPKAIEAIKTALNDLALYPNPDSIELVEKLSNLLNRKPSEIIATHGSESLITHIINAFSDVGEEVLTASITFIGIFTSTHKLGRKIITVPTKDYAYDLTAILNAINDKTRIIYLANVNNPTGTMFTKTDFVEFMKQVPSNIIVILDEAYYHYSVHFEDYPDGVHFNYSNLIITRTFSKSHGLAGLRIGYGIGPEEIVDVLYKVKLPFEPSLLAQKAAFSAIDDNEFVNQSIKTNSIAMKMLINKLDELNIFYPEPKANFVFITF